MGPLARDNVDSLSGRRYASLLRQTKASDGALPVVIVVQEIFGVHEHIRDICRRLALEGYLAIAPELYFREGDPNDFADIPTLLSGLVAKVPDSQVLADGSRRQLGFAQRRGRASADDHRFLLGRPDYSAVRRAQPTVKSGGSVVRQAGGRHVTQFAEASR